MARGPEGDAPRFSATTPTGIVRSRTGVPVQGWRRGLVCGFDRAPRHQQRFHLVDEPHLGAKPKSLDFARGCIAVHSITAWEILFDRFNVARGAETVHRC